MTGMELLQEVDLPAGEGEGLHGVQEAARAGHDAEAPGGGQPPPEQLEDAGPLGGPRAKRPLEHGELVHVGEQGRGGSGRICDALRGCHDS